MINLEYKGTKLSYDEADNKVFINDKEDTHKVYSPSFVNNGDNEKPTFIGFVRNRDNKFISLSGKTFDTIKPEDITV